MAISLPQRLEEILRQDRSLHGDVGKTLAAFDEWLPFSHAPLFPEYTDHGEKHIQNVLSTASSLVRDAAWPLLRPMDVALIVLATLYHDAAMHLTEDGFASLTGGAAGERRIPEFDAEDWPSMFATYRHKARRWSEKQQRELFGQAGQVDCEPGVRPAEDLQKMFCGEFVRRNHARFAHEAALFGIPGPDGESLDPASWIDSEVRDLAGLLARSHWMPVRQIIPYLEGRYRPAEYQGGHPVFLATLIRVADYLEISPERAPPAMLTVRRLRSPVSQREWDFSEAITNVSTKERDRELVRVTARPQDVETYLKVKEWLEGLQGELDASWAVLGEVYSLLPGLSEIGLALRRVASNLDDLTTFAPQVEYVPRRVRLEVARAEVLPLLVGPLYDHNPSVGVRELLQNALDAVRELRDCRSDYASVPTYEQEGDIEIWLGEPGAGGEVFVTVTDKGIGMTEEVVREYFLTAGATYRSSDQWKDLHERPEGEGAEGEPLSRVLRSGRFGVGVLACFLLGDEVSVVTRHVSQPEDRAIAFTMRPDSEVIELRYCKAPVGTRVRVRSSDATVRSAATGGDDEPDLSRWYVLEDPRVILRLGPEAEVIRQTVLRPSVDAALPPDWYRIEAKGFADVQWSAVTRRPGSSYSELVCNGIPVAGLSTIGSCRLAGGGIVRPPCVDVFDADARLSLGLKRDRLAGRSSFDPDLRADVMSWLFAWVLATPATVTPARLVAGRCPEPPTRSHLTYSAIDEFVAVPTGYSMLEVLPQALSAGFAGRLVLDGMLTSTRDFPAWLSDVGEDLLVAGTTFVALRDPGGRGEPELLSVLRTLLKAWGVKSPASLPIGTPPLRHWETWRDFLAEDIPGGAGVRVVVSSAEDWLPDDTRWDSLGFSQHPGPAGEPLYSLLLESPGCGASRLPICRDGGPPLGCDTPLVVMEVYSPTPPPALPEYQFVADLWMETFGTPVIPYDIEQRKRELAPAYKKLARFLESGYLAARAAGTAE